MQRWQGRALPVAFNKTTNEWSILLGHDRGGCWSDFSLASKPGEKGDAIAQRALNAQTGGYYTPSFAGAPWRRTPNGDILHFVKVTYTDASTLRSQASNATKDDFVWIPFSEFSQYNVVSRPTRGQWTNVSRGIQNMIKQYLPQVKSELDKLVTVTTPLIGTQPQAGVKSWFNIPGAIYFYTKGKPYYEFTNFAEGYPFQLKGDTWVTSEQYYQAQKFVGNRALYNTIRDFRTDQRGSSS